VERARSLLERACAAKNGRACFNLAEVTEDRGDEANAVSEYQEQAVKYLAIECDGAEYHACAMLGRLFLKGIVVDEMKERGEALKGQAAKLMNEGCDAGDALACLELADDEPEQTTKALRRACEIGVADACGHGHP